MKTKILFTLFLMYSIFLFAQNKEKNSSENQKFYFPASSFSNPKVFDKNLQQLITQIAPLEIDEKTQKFSKDAEMMYLIQKNYSGLVNYSKNEKFPKKSLPLKSYAEAMIAYPFKGNQFKKIFTENFSKEYHQLDGSTKTSIANDYFEEKMLGEYHKMILDFKDELSKNKTDSINYNDAKKLISIEGFNDLSKTILPLGKNVVKDYILEYYQPYLTGSLWMSVLKPKEATDLPDLSKDYKLLFELTDFSNKNNKETAYKNENSTLIEAARIINLHIGSGIPAEKLKIVFIVHGNAIDILMNNEMYKNKYQVDNPNLDLVKQMQSKGLKFIVCGQLMSWRGLRLSDLTENVTEAFSAKTALSNYQTNGYILYELEDEN